MAIAPGSHHVVAITYKGKAYSWGKNHKGQLGRGFESPMEIQPAAIDMKGFGTFYSVSSGYDHTIAIVDVTGPDGKPLRRCVMGWGDESRGQLGSADLHSRSRPQENRYTTRFLTKNNLNPTAISAGGHHNLLLATPVGLGTGMAVSWGANSYGQLGNGYLWDDPQPNFILGLKDVIQVSAGLRHSMALTGRDGATELSGWGYNAYGELGLGDTEMRVMPTKISALFPAKVYEVSCGDRHTVVRTSHRPIVAREDSQLRPYFDIIEGVRYTPHPLSLCMCVRARVHVCVPLFFVRPSG